MKATMAHEQGLAWGWQQMVKARGWAAIDRRRIQRWSRGELLELVCGEAWQRVAPVEITIEEAAGRGLNWQRLEKKR